MDSKLLRPDWTLAKAIQKQVDREDMLRWALEPMPEHKVIPPMPCQALPRHRLRHFVRSIIA
jgi:hypothetical protein